MGSNGARGGGNTGPANKYSTPGKKVVDFIKGGGITGAIVRGIGKGIETIKKNYNIRKTNESLLGSADYQGGKTLSGSIVRTNDNDKGNNRPDNNSNATIPLIPIATAPTVAEVSQSSATTAEAPTMTIEPVMTSEEATANANKILLKKKARGRSSTILTSSTGVSSQDKLTLGKKSLLGS